MTLSEHKFFDALQEIYGSRYYIFPQVHISSLLDVNKREKNWYGNLNRIIKKSVDFAICDKHDISPLLVIELDDYTHNWASRKSRDEKVEKLFQEAGLRLERFKTQQTYNFEEIKAKVNLDIVDSNPQR